MCRMSKVECILPSFYRSTNIFYLSRLKIRCDRKVPCKSCTVSKLNLSASVTLLMLRRSLKRRGCRNLCPDGEAVMYTTNQTTELPSRSLRHCRWSKVCSRIPNVKSTNRRTDKYLPPQTIFTELSLICAVVYANSRAL
jgi:hypothetical protein